VSEALGSLTEEAAEAAVNDMDSAVRLAGKGGAGDRGKPPAAELQFRRRGNGIAKRGYGW